MACWRRHDAVVIAVCTEDQELLHEQLHRCLYGVESRGHSAGSRARELSLWEAYYALSQDGLLMIPPDQSLRDIWWEFATASSSFVSLYVVYHHFRRLGWLLRSGLNYGAQFVLYRGDATAFHSEYIVYVHGGVSASWHSVQALTRVAQDVKKTVIMCEVTTTSQEVEQTSGAGQAVGSGAPSMATHGVFDLNGKSYALDAVLIRFWDTAAVDEDREDYAFTTQPMLLKKKKKKAKTKASGKKPLVREPEVL